MSDKKKNSIKLGLRDEQSFEGEIDTEEFKAKVEQGKKLEEVVAPAIIFSTVDYPVTIKYGNDSVRITGRAREKFADFSKLPTILPTGLVVKKL
jgi:hypothetical protein